MTQDFEKDNTDVRQHLLNIDARLDRLSGTVAPTSFLTEEVDLWELWNILWRGKWWIIGITFLFTVAAVILALTLPNRYKAEIVLAPAQEQNSGLGGLASQYGGLAAMAGISLGDRNPDVDQAMALVKSWPFLNSFVDKFDLKPKIMAIKRWDSVKDKIVYDDNLYNPEAKEWLREPKPHRPAEPTSYEVYEEFSKMLSVTHDGNTGLIQITVEHYVPQLAYEWVKLLAQELNNHFQVRDIRDANRNIEYLREKIDETSIAEMQAVFYRMIESQMQTLMLAEVSNEYLVKSVVEARVPEEKSRPKRSLICILGVLFGGMISVGFVLACHILKRARSKV